MSNSSSKAPHVAEVPHVMKQPEVQPSPVAESPLTPTPPEFVCPITGKVMDDPVTAADGRTYEKDAIEMWMEIGNSEFPGGKGTSPSINLFIIPVLNA